MEFLDINLTKYSNLMLHASDSPFYWRILKNTMLYSSRLKMLFKNSISRVVKQFCRIWIWSHSTECKSPAVPYMVYNNPTQVTQHPLFRNTLYSVYCTYLHLRVTRGRVLNLRQCRWTHPGVISIDDTECFAASSFLYAADKYVYSKYIFSF